MSIDVLVRIKSHPNVNLGVPFPVHAIRPSVTCAQCRGTRKQGAPLGKLSVCVASTSRTRVAVAGPVEGNISWAGGRRPCWRGPPGQNRRPGPFRGESRRPLHGAGVTKGRWGRGGAELRSLLLAGKGGARPSGFNSRLSCSRRSPPDCNVGSPSALPGGQSAWARVPASWSPGRVCLPVSAEQHPVHASSPATSARGPVPGAHAFVGVINGPTAQATGSAPGTGSGPVTMRVAPPRGSRPWALLPPPAWLSARGSQ